MGSLSHSNTGVSSPLPCKTLQAMQQQHMQDASSLEVCSAWPWGCPRIGWVQVRRTNSSSTATFPAPKI